MVGTCNIVVISKVHETLKFLLQFTFLPGLRGYSLMSTFLRQPSALIFAA